MIREPTVRADVVVVIPARAGSKGVPGKNLARVGGVPLVARAVAACRAAELVDRVLVSTDDAGIAAASRAVGAEIVERPAHLAGDTATSESAVLHALDSLDADPQVVLLVQATSPFLDPRDLDQAIGEVLDGMSDSVFSAVETHGFLWRRGAAGATGVNHDPGARPRRQDRAPEYLETGAFYAMRTEGFRAAGFRFFGRVDPVVIDARRALEIDTAGELEMAQLLSPMFPIDTAPDVDAVVMDFDGVHTDDLVHVDSAGVESVRVSRSDGFGLERLRLAGVPMLVISRESDPVVTRRAHKLGLEVRQGIGEKTSVLAAWAEEHGLDVARIAYVGNDLPDLGPMSVVGWPVAVADAHQRVRAAARLVLERPGGRGALRELADLILPISPAPSASPS